MRQLEVEFAPLAREKGLELTFVPCSLRGALRPAAAAAAAAEPGLQRHQVHAARAASLVGCRPRGRQAAHRRVRHRPRHSASRRRRAIFQRIPPARSGRQGRARPRARPVDRRAHRPRARPQGRAALEPSAAARASRSRCRCRRGAVSGSARARAAASIRGQLAGMVVLCIDNEPEILDGMETLLGGWGCQVLKAPDLDGRASRRSPKRRRRPARLLVDYHLDRRQRHRCDRARCASASARARRRS